MNYLIVGPSGSGKTTAIMGSEEHGIKGLPLKNTLIFTCSLKKVPHQYIMNGDVVQSLFNKTKFDLESPVPSNVVALEPDLKMV